RPRHDETQCAGESCAYPARPMAKEFRQLAVHHHSEARHPGVRSPIHNYVAANDPAPRQAERHRANPTMSIDFPASLKQVAAAPVPPSLWIEVLPLQQPRVEVKI